MYSAVLRAAHQGLQKNARKIGLGSSALFLLLVRPQEADPVKYATPKLSTDTPSIVKPQIPSICPSSPSLFSSLSIPSFSPVLLSSPLFSLLSSSSRIAASPSFGSFGGTDDDNNSVINWFFRIKDDPKYVALKYLYASNTGVFLMWQAAKIVPESPLYDFMYRHFTASESSIQEGRMHTMFTSAFSHKGVIHFACNMYALNLFGMPLCRYMNASSLLSFFSFAAVLSSVAGIKSHGGTPMLGASGGVLGLLTLYAAFYPHNMHHIYFPFPGAVLSSWGLVGMLSSIDLVGLLFLRNFSPFSHAAHLAGVGAGLFYYLSRSALGDEQMIPSDRLLDRYWLQVPSFLRVPAELLFLYPWLSLCEVIAEQQLRILKEEDEKTGSVVRMPTSLRQDYQKLYKRLAHVKRKKDAISNGR